MSDLLDEETIILLDMERPAQIFASIDDLLIQVFLRLPVKQLCRFKLVSKHWNSIISDPKLPLLLRNPEPAVGLIFHCQIISHHDEYNPFLSYILYFNKPTVPKKIGDGAKVLHSCNGLLLCDSVSGIRRHIIYNPITKKTSTLHPGTGLGSKLFIVGMYLAFDPCESCHYKFVCVVGLGDNWFHPQGHDRFKFEVYSSETGSWRRCGEPFSATVDFEDGGVYWKGAIHWVSLKKSGKPICFNPCGDVNDRMLPTVMPSPKILEDATASYKGKHHHYGVKMSSPQKKGRNYHFGESCGHLNFIDARRRAFEFDVYEMKMDYSEWFVKYRVDLSNVVSDFFCVCTLVREKKDDDDSFLVLRIGRKFMRCNLVDKTCETIFECRGINDTELEKELLGYDGEFPLQYIEGAYGNLDGVWYTKGEIRSQEEHQGFFSF